MTIRNVVIAPLYRHQQHRPAAQRRREVAGELLRLMDGVPADRPVRFYRAESYEWIWTVMW